MKLSNTQHGSVLGPYVSHKCNQVRSGCIRPPAATPLYGVVLSPDDALEHLFPLIMPLR